MTEVVSSNQGSLQYVGYSHLSRVCGAEEPCGTESSPTAVHLRVVDGAEQQQQQQRNRSCGSPPAVEVTCTAHHFFPNPHRPRTRRGHQSRGERTSGRTVERLSEAARIGGRECEALPTLKIWISRRRPTFVPSQPPFIYPQDYNGR